MKQRETIEQFLARGGKIVNGPLRGVPKKPVTAKHHNRSHGGRKRSSNSENVERQIVNANYRGKIGK
jgi:hypothetical protein